MRRGSWVVPPGSAVTVGKGHASLASRMSSSPRQNAHDRQVQDPRQSCVSQRPTGWLTGSTEGLLMGGLGEYHGTSSGCPPDTQLYLANLARICSLQEVPRLPNPRCWCFPTCHINSESHCPVSLPAALHLPALFFFSELSRYMSLTGSPPWSLVQLKAVVHPGYVIKLRARAPRRISQGWARELFILT